MELPNGVVEEIPSAPLVLQLLPLNKADKGIWTVTLEPELLTVYKPDETPVFYLHQEEAARYVKIELDIFRGRRVTFVIVEGLKSYSFRCSREQIRVLLDWLPHKDAAEEAKEIRRSALGVALFGTLHMLLPFNLFWGWGVVMLVVGGLGLAIPKGGRRMHLLNGAAMIAIGLWDLFKFFVQILRGAVIAQEIPQEDLVIPILVGSVLVLWGIQQISMLSAKQQLRASRAIRDAHADFLPKSSPVIRRVGYVNILASVAFAMYSLAVLTDLLIRSEKAGGSTIVFESLPDLLVFGTVSILAFSMGAVFLVWQRPAYFEAKVATQTLIAVAVITFWGVIFRMVAGGPLAFFGSIFSGDLTPFTNIYVWGSMVLCVVLFNRWFAGIIDRDIETQRGQW